MFAVWDEREIRFRSESVKFPELRDTFEELQFDSIPSSTLLYSEKHGERLRNSKPKTNQR